MGGGTVIFKQEDFLDCGLLTPFGIACRAETILSDYLEKCPKVYCTKRDSLDQKHWTASEHQHSMDTHKAFLFNLEPLFQPHECEPANWADSISTQASRICKHCGVSLKPVKWAKA